MYNERQQVIIDRLNVFIAECGTQNKAAELLGISSAILTPLRKGTYPGDIDKHLEKIADTGGEGVLKANFFESTVTSYNQSSAVEGWEDI